MARLRWRSLRLRTLVVVGVVALAPIPLVWGYGLVDETTGRVMLAQVRRAAAEAAIGDEAEVARSRRVRVTVKDAEGRVEDGEVPSLLERLDSLFYPGASPPGLDDWISDLEPPGARCASNEDLTLLVCEAAVRRPDGTVVLVQRASHRAVRALYTTRWPLLQLSLVMGLVAAGLGGWLGWRWIRPVTTLRRAVLERVRHPLQAQPIALRRDDELGDLAGAFDQLLAAVRTQAAAHEAFVADLAHEMKNPVAAVRAAAEALERGAVTPERAERLARALAASSDRLDRLVTGLLELARAEAGLPAEPRVRLRLDTVVAGVVDGLDVELEAAPVEVDGVSERLETAVRNLVLNARAFAGEGGVVRVRVAREARALVEVRDSGPGVPVADRPRIFDRFVTSRAGGTGLGLALVKAIAVAHGGEVAVGDAPEGGAVFRLILP